jgi:hypothetical protein
MNAHSRRQSRNSVGRRTLNPLKKLPRSRRKGFDIPPLTLCVQSIECQAAFAGTAEPANDRQSLMADSQGHLSEIVDPDPFKLNTGLGTRQRGTHRKRLQCAAAETVSWQKMLVVRGSRAGVSNSAARLTGMASSGAPTQHKDCITQLIVQNQFRIRLVTEIVHTQQFKFRHGIQQPAKLVSPINSQLMITSQPHDA